MIELYASPGTEKLPAGRWVAVDIVATAPLDIGVYTWPTQGDQDTPFAAASDALGRPKMAARVVRISFALSRGHYRKCSFDLLGNDSDKTLWTPRAYRSSHFGAKLRRFCALQGGYIIGYTDC